MTSGQEMEQVYSYNPGARTGQTEALSNLLVAVVMLIMTDDVSWGTGTRDQSART